MKSSLLCALGLGLVVSGCGITRFGLGYDVAEQVVPGSVVGGLLGADPIQIPINVDLATETSARGTGPARHVYLTSFTLSVTTTSEPSGDSDDLGFIDRIEIFTQSGRAGSTLPRVRIAHRDRPSAPRDRARARVVTATWFPHD